MSGAHQTGQMPCRRLQSSLQRLWNSTLEHRSGVSPDKSAERLESSSCAHQAVRCVPAPCPGHVRCCYCSRPLDKAQCCSAPYWHWPDRSGAAVQQPTHSVYSRVFIWPSFILCLDFLHVLWIFNMASNVLFEVLIIRIITLSKSKPTMHLFELYLIY